MSRSLLPAGAAVLAGIVVVLAGCGGGGLQPCAVYQRSSQAHLVLHPAGGTNAEARGVCARLANAWSKLSGNGGGRPSVVKAKSAYGGDLLLCSRHGAVGEVDVYAKRRSASTTALCTVLGPFGGRTTEVVRLTRLAQPPVYFVLSGGPSTAVKVIAQRLLSLSEKNFRLAVVPKPVGQKGCTFHRGISVAIYSPSNNAIASICHGPGFRKLLESHK